MIRSQEDVENGLRALVALDPRLQKVVDGAGEVQLRQNPPGLTGLVFTLMGQQVSRASASAIFARLAARVDLEDPAAILAAGGEDFRFAGLSQAKERTLLALAQAVRDGRLDLTALAEAPPDAALSALITLPGIGPWTTECFLLFSLGHPDVFPAGDLALQVAVAEALGLPARPKEKALALIASAWRPHRSVAAHLFWRHYHVLTRREAAPAGEPDARGFTKATR